MALPVAAAFVAAGLAGAGGARAQTPPAPSPPAEAVEASLSPECRVPGSKLYTIAPLKAVKAALRDDRAVRVLVIGAVGGGSAFSGMSNYPSRLRTELEKQFKNVDVEVIHRGLSGEVGTAAGERVRAATAEIGPDLVVWQVATNDALARVETGQIVEALDETVTWLKSHEIDTILVDPQYTAAVGDDEHYAGVVKVVGEAAARHKVPLLLRYEAMKYLASRDPGQGGGFALNALGKRCMAEHVARTIAVAILLEDEPAATNALTR